MGMKWEKARKQEKADKARPEWTPPSAPEDGSKDTRTIREKIADGEIGQG